MSERLKPLHALLLKQHKEKAQQQTQQDVSQTTQSTEKSEKSDLFPWFFPAFYNLPHWERLNSELI